MHDIIWKKLETMSFSVTIHAIWFHCLINMIKARTRPNSRWFFFFTEVFKMNPWKFVGAAYITENPEWIIWLIWAIVCHHTDKKTHFHTFLSHLF